jgi:DNA polymerase-1
MLRLKVINELSETRKKIFDALGEEVSGEALQIAFVDKGEKKVNQLKGYRKKSEFDKLIGEFGEFYFLRYENILKENMESAIKLNIPLEVEIESGTNWYDAK